MARALQRITYVEDEPDIRAIANLLLTQVGGFETDMCASGQEALDRTGDFNPDLILLDVMMPRMSGFEVCQKIKSDPASRDTAVIMVTALNEVPDYERAVESGTDDFLSKPVNKIELLTRVKSLLRVRLLRKRLDALMSGPDQPGG